MTTDGVVYSFRVTVRAPVPMREADVREFIRDAVSTWGGQYEPPNADNAFTGDPRFFIGKPPYTVEVVRYQTRRG